MYEDGKKEGEKEREQEDRNRIKRSIVLSRHEGQLVADLRLISIAGSIRQTRECPTRIWFDAINYLAYLEYYVAYDAIAIARQIIIELPRADLLDRGGRSRERIKRGR